MQETWVQSLDWEDPLEKEYSCLGNPLERGAWQATVHGVAKESVTDQWLNNKSAYKYLMQYKCYVNSCQHVANSNFAFGKFLELSKNSFDVQMQNSLEQRGNCMPKQLQPPKMITVIEFAGTAAAVTVIIIIITITI